MPCRLILVAVAMTLLLPSLAQAKRLEVSEIKSNSVLTDSDKGVVYDAGKMLDEQVGTMWVEGEGNAGLGKYIEVKFDGDVELARVRIWAGCFVDKEFWGRHNRVRIVELKYPDFSSERIELKDQMEAQWLELAEPKVLDKVKIYLRAVYEGNTWNDTAISQIEFFDASGPEEELEGLTATASSSYPDKENAYGPHLAVDGWLDTHWVEGGETGEGEFLDIALPGKKSLKRFAISVGYDSTDSFFAGHNRARQVVLSFSDGSRQTFELRDIQGLQTFDLSPVSTSSVRVTFSKIVRGKSHNDLYVGEVRFWD